MRVAPMLGLLRMLSDHGVDPDVVVRDVGLEPALFADPENVIPFSDVGRLLVHAAAITGSPYPGLELGRSLGLDVLGALGKAIRFAPDLGTALRILILHFHLHDRGAIPSLWEFHDRAMFGYTLYCSDVPGTDHIYDAALVIARNMFLELLGNEWRMTEVRLFREAPDDLKLFRRHFGTRVRYGAERAGIAFPASDLSRPLRQADPDAFASALRDLEDRENTGDISTLAHKVRRVLYRMFVDGSGSDGVQLLEIARLFALHPRTLNRRLRAEGTTFNALLARTRYEIARQLLRDTRLRTAEIAFFLGYSETASFNHAFRRWSGTTASEWRSSHRSN